MLSWRYCDIMHYLIPETAYAVSAIGVADVLVRLQSIAYLTVFFESSLIGHIHFHWLAPVKVRRMMFAGSRQMSARFDSTDALKVEIHPLIDNGIAPLRVAELLEAAAFSMQDRGRLMEFA